MAGMPGLPLGGLQMPGAPRQVVVDRQPRSALFEVCAEVAKQSHKTLLGRTWPLCRVSHFLTHYGVSKYIILYVLGSNANYTISGHDEKRHKRQAPLRDARGRLAVVTSKALQSVAEFSGARSVVAPVVGAPPK